MSWVYAAPLALVASLVIVLAAGALELGHRMGRVAPVEDQQVSTVSAPILAIVALLLAFSFAMAAERYSIRRAAAIQEANSIGTFWLRTSLLPEPVTIEARSRLRRYVELHIEHRQAVIDERRLAEIEAEAASLQAELWAMVDAEAERGAPLSTPLLVVPALNAMIDDAATAVAARENRLPDPLLVYLFLLVGAAALVIGYRPRGERRNLVLWGVLLFVVGGVMVILLDLDRPRRGLIQVDVRPYLRLRDSMQND